MGIPLPDLVVVRLGADDDFFLDFDGCPDPSGVGRTMGTTFCLVTVPLEVLVCVTTTSSTSFKALGTSTGSIPDRGILKIGDMMCIRDEEYVTRVGSDITISYLVTIQFPEMIYQLGNQSVLSVGQSGIFELGS